MSLHVISTDGSFAQALTTTLVAEQVTTFASTADAIIHLLHKDDRTGDLLLIDLRTTPDAERFIGFAKATRLRSIPIITLGCQEDYLSFEPIPSLSVVAKFYPPKNADELELLAATLQQHMPPPQTLRATTPYDQRDGAPATPAGW